MNNKTVTREEKKHNLRVIIAEAMDSINELKEQLDGIDEKSECAKLLIDDLIMIKSEAMVELLRLKLSEELTIDEEMTEELE